MSELEVTIDPAWEPPAWIAKGKYSRRELQWLTAAFSDRMQAVQAQNRALKAKLIRMGENTDA